MYAADAPLAGTVAYAGRRGLDRRLESGPEQVWSAGPVDGFPHRPAVADGRLVVGSYADDGYASVARGDGSGRVVALDLSTGETRWRNEVGFGARSPFVGGSTFVVAGERDAGEDRRAGVVRAYDTETGETLWTRGIDGPPGGLALVGEWVVVTAGPSVYELA